MCTYPTKKLLKLLARDAATYLGKLITKNADLSDDAKESYAQLRKKIQSYCMHERTHSVTRTTEYGRLGIFIKCNVCLHETFLRDFF